MANFCEIESQKDKNSNMDEDNFDVDDDNESDLNEEQSNVDIGIINEDEKTKLIKIQLHSSTYYPCKLGGKPQWLSYKNFNLLAEHLKCDNCKSKLSFLLQIYAPINKNSENDDDDDDSDYEAFHRYLYVFLCTNVDCKKPSFKVYRSQLNRKNDYYSFEAPPYLEHDDSKNSPNIDFNKINTYLSKFYKNLFEKNLYKVCNICGFPSSKYCAKCKTVYYCSEEHQKLDWITYKHKITCNKYCASQNQEEKGKYKIRVIFGHCSI